jgi:pyridoxine 5-phosphate synthase
VELLKTVLHSKLNLEMAATPEMVEIACRLKPQECTLVPEKRQELTTEGGLDVAKDLANLTAVCSRLQQAGIEVSLFIDPDPRQVAAAARCGVPLVEMHTGLYSLATGSAQVQELKRLAAAGQAAKTQGLRLNAGHGLNYANVAAVAGIPGIEDLNIGHSIISRAVMVGLQTAVIEMLAMIGFGSAGPFGG